MLNISHLNKSFGEKQVLFDVNFDVPSGQIVGLIGKNGAGKSTIFHSLLNFIRYDGQITFENKPITSKTFNRIGYLPEERSLNTKQTAYQQLTYFGELKGLSAKEAVAGINEWWNKLQVKGDPNSKIKELSKGNQQKLQLIATLLHEPDLIILDEPFSGLDPINAEIFQHVILDEKLHGASIIFSDHNMANVEAMCDSVVMIHEGRIVLNGDINQVRNQFGKTNLFVRTDMRVSDIRRMPGVKAAEYQKDGKIRISLADESYGPQLFDVISHGKYLPTFDQEPPTLDEIFKMKARKRHA